MEGQEDRIMRKAEVRHVSGLCNSAIYATPGFPRPVKLGGGRASGWSALEVYAWVRETIAKSRRESAGASNG